MIYANQAGSSWPKPEPVRAAVAEALTAPPETWGDRFAEQRRAIAGAFGIEDPERLLLTPGATSALSVGVSDLPWQAGDRVIVSGFEHHALHRPVLQLAERGVEVVVAPCRPGEPIVLPALEAELARGRTRLVAMTAACNVTGEILPVSEITALARSYGALSLIDAAQIAGWIAIHAKSFGADLFSFAGHKGPQGPWGVGGLYVAPEVATLSPGTEGHEGEGAPSTDPRMISACEVGSADRTSMAGLVAGLEWVHAPERRSRLEVARAGIAQIFEGIRGRGDVRVHGPVEPTARLPILALTQEGRNPAELECALAARGVIASAGSQCAPLAHRTLGTSEAGVLRLSLGPGNRSSDGEEVARALRDCLGPARSGGVARR